MLHQQSPMEKLRAISKFNFRRCLEYDYIGLRGHMKFIYLF